MKKEEKMPIYKINKRRFTQKEEEIINELRNNLIDLSLSSGDKFKINREELKRDIKKFIKQKISENSDLINYSENENERNIYKNDLYENDLYENDLYENDLYMNQGKYIENLSEICFQAILGYGEIDPLLDDDDLEEIMVVGVNKPVFVYHREYGMMKTTLQFTDEKNILSLIDSMAREINRRIDRQSPILDGRLSDGSRINATLSPISADGPTLTIRKFKKDPLTIIDLIRFNTINSSLGAFFWLVVDGMGVKPANIIISGGTSSGKTTTLNSLGNFISPRERIITIEDTLELQIPHEHVLRMETRQKNIEKEGEITMDNLLKNSLRQRPDRIIVGEVRGKEAITLFTALNTGHSGFGTLHANNSRETINRLIHPPMEVPKIMISAIDMIIMQNRIYKSDGVSIRRVTEVSEVVGMEEGTVQLNKIFKWNPELDTIENISLSSKTLEEIAKIKGIEINEIESEIRVRKKVLEFMVNRNIRSNKEVSKVFQEYYNNPEKILKSIEQVKHLNNKI